MFKIFCEMKTVQLQKQFSSYFSTNLILAQVHHNHPAGDAKRVSVVPVKMTVKNKWVAGMPSVSFVFFFVLFVAVEIDSKLTLRTPFGESSIIQPTELTHICLVDFSILIIWTSSFLIIGVSGVLFSFILFLIDIHISKQSRP